MMRIRDLASRGLGVQRSKVPDLELHGLHRRAQSDRAISSLKTNGVVVLRDVLSASKLRGVCDAVRRYGVEIRDRIDHDRGFDDLDPKFHFNAPTYAADLVALDPATAEQPNELQLSETTLCQAIMASPLGAFLERLLSTYASWSMARVRLVFADLAAQEKSGGLKFHQEKTVTPFPGLHNLWTPLVDSDIVTGVDVPGIQFYVGSREILRNRRQDRAIEQKNQELLASLTRNAQADEYQDDDGFLYRPALRTGDVAIFESSVPHASYVPPGSTGVRASFDIRLFPTPNDRGPKPFFT